MMLFAVLLYGLCAGSFLGSFAWRIVAGKKLFTWRSYCPQCEIGLAWYDMIPIVSYFFLHGRARCCGAFISPLYMVTELFAGIIFVQLWRLSYPPSTTMLYALALSALIVAMRTDLEALVIPQLCSLWMIIPGVLGAFLGYLPISPLESICGACIGYGILWITAFFFRKVRGIDGLGVGDMELLAMIGAWWGPRGVWWALACGSASGLCIGALYLLISGKSRDTAIPFGPFLVGGALVYGLLLAQPISHVRDHALFIDCPYISTFSGE